MSVSLTNLLVPSKEVTVEYPGMPGFELQIKFLSRETLQKLRKKATKVTFKRGQPIEEFNDDLFLKLYVAETLVGWTGLKLSYLELLAPINLGDVDRETELVFSEEEALMLMKNSTDLDNFISEKVTDLSNFSANK